MSRRSARASIGLLVLLLVAAGCGRSARDGAGQETTTLPSTTPVASELEASVADTAPDATVAAPAAEAPPDGDATGESAAAERLADIVEASIEQLAGTVRVHIRLARPLDGEALVADDQISVGAYLLADPDDLEPYAARVLIDAGRPPRFLFGPWLEPGRPVEGSLEGTDLELVVHGLEQGRFRYAQFFAEDPAGTEVLPEDGAGMVAINAPDRTSG